MAQAQQERSPMQRALVNAAVAAREIALTLLQVALFFSIFLLILQVSLPRGTGLQRVYADLLSGKKQAASVALNGDTMYDLGPVATLTDITRQVKDRRADGVAWQKSAAGMELDDRHAIQTLTRSAATIEFADNNRLWLDENSLVVIKRPTRGTARTRRASLTVLGGKVRGTIMPAGGRARGRTLAVETASGAAEISSPTGEATEFSVAVNADQSSTLSVLSGLAEIEKAGQSIRLDANHALTIDVSGALSEPVRIPDPPRPESPADGFVHVSGPSTPPLEFRWNGASGADAYRLVIARDAGLTETVFDSPVDATRIRPANLDPGRYYWEVFSLAGNSESEPGEVRAVDIVGDTDPPPLSVSMPQGAVTGSSLTVSGTTEPGTAIHIAGDDVEVDPDGRFEYEIQLAPGPNLIVVEAVDRAGNVAYHSQYVHAKF